MKNEYVIVVKEFSICDMNEHEENVNAFFLSRNTKNKDFATEKNIFHFLISVLSFIWASLHLARMNQTINMYDYNHYCCIVGIYRYTRFVVRFL